MDIRDSVPFVYMYSLPTDDEEKEGRGSGLYCTVERNCELSALILNLLKRVYDTVGLPFKEEDVQGDSVK